MGIGKCVAFVLVLCSLPSAVVAEDTPRPTMADFLSAAKSKDGDRFVGLVVGDGRGLGAANKVLEMNGQSKLYCQPDIPITGDQYLRILEQRIERVPAKAAELSTLFAVFLAVAMRDAFPCK